METGLFISSLVDMTNLFPTCIGVFIFEFLAFKRIELREEQLANKSCCATEKDSCEYNQRQTSCNNYLSVCKV